MFKSKGFYPLLLAFLFLIFGILTLNHYGVSWDSSNHYLRGQALLHYLFTGEKDYQNWTGESINSSVFQARSAPAQYYFEKKYMAHPPLPDLLSSFFNYILYQRLGIFPDIESYHLFIVLVSSLLVFVLACFTQELYGTFAALVTSLTLVLYPLFLAESHFNIKDPVEAAFYGLTIYAFFKAITRSSWRWMITSALFCGLAFGTKWNIVFLPFILFPWVLIRKKKDFLKNKKLLLSFLIYPLIVFIVFLIFDPLVWSNPLERTWEIFKWYKKAGGSGNRNQPASFFFLGFNSYPFLTVLYTTPLVTLFLAGVGIIVALLRFRKEENASSFLILLWFLIPILRVTVPGTSIYGGLRQIMEFVPAVAILAGLGAGSMVRWLYGYMAKIKTINHLAIWPFSHSARKTRLILFQALTLLMFLPLLIKMIKIHPNQNAYFNPLISGLKGAKERDYPGWGVTMGTQYKQGVEWLNQHAQANAKVALLVSTRVVVPEIYFRPDLNFANSNWSRKERKGEYLMEAIYDDWIRVYYYAGEFAKEFLIPVHEIKVDGVPIFKIWKNDPQHTYPRYLQEKTMDSKKIKWSQEGNIILIELEEPVELMEMGIDYEGNDCLASENTQVLLSVDKEKWTRLKEPIREEYLVGPGRLIYPLVSVKGKYLKIRTKTQAPCLFQVKGVKIGYL